jgi:hypothetical protein
MEPAAERDAATVTRAAARGDPSSDFGLVPYMLPDPWLAFGKERGSSPFMLRPDRPCRDRDDHATVRVDDDAQDARPRGAPERIGERPARQLGDRGGLGRHATMMPSRTWH